MLVYLAQADGSMVFEVVGKDVVLPRRVGAEHSVIGVLSPASSALRPPVASWPHVVIVPVKIPRIIAVVRSSEVICWPVIGLSRLYIMQVAPATSGRYWYA